MAMFEVEFKGILTVFPLSPMSLCPCLDCLRSLSPYYHLEEASGVLTKDHSHECLSRSHPCGGAGLCHHGFQAAQALVSR